MISSAKPDPNVVDKLAKEWVISFSSIMPGHDKSNVTPYTHIMAFHVPDVMRKFGNIRQFSGQGKYFLYEILLIINVILQVLKRIMMMPSDITIQETDMILIETFLYQRLV